MISIIFKKSVIPFVVALFFLTSASNLYAQFTIPARNADAPVGSEVYEQIRTLRLDEREAVIVDAFLSGNVPEWLRREVRIEVESADKNGALHQVTFWILPDYLAFGSDNDFFRIPMSPLSAQLIADTWGAALPTPKIVDIIYEHSVCKLAPFNYKPRGHRNEEVDLFYDHSKVISAQQFASGTPYGAFTAGTKKDIVICDRLSDTSRIDHVTIYGWHTLNGRPIQPVTNVHINNYIDYSHGVRLVAQTVLVDGQAFRLEELLSDPLYYTLLSRDPEPLQKPHYRGEQWHNKITEEGNY